MTDNATIKGYDIDEIDEIARDVFQLLTEQGVDINLSILGLCRAITILADEEQLDYACRMIDVLSEVPYDEGDYEDDLEWDEEEEDGK